MITSIYALAEPSGLIRYVGKAVDPAARFKRHLIDANNRGMRVCRWIKRLAKRGLMPTMHIIEECAGDGCAEEIFHIALARRDGLQLYNSTLGGEGALGYRLPPDAIERMRAKKIGKKQSPELIERRVAPLRGRKQSPEHIEKRTAPQRGKKIPAWQVQMLVNIHTGSHHTEEHRRKISAAGKGKPKPVGFGEKISKALTGKTASEASKQKQSATRKRLYRENPERFIRALLLARAALAAKRVKINNTSASALPTAPTGATNPVETAGS